MKRIIGTLAGVAAGLLLVASANATPVTMEHGLIKGMGGALYQPYKESIVREAQQALKQRGLLEEPANGVFDEATMQALGRFQKQHGLVVTGIPTPLTRRELLAD